jgi:hypothetical protein
VFENPAIGGTGEAIGSGNLITLLRFGCKLLNAIDGQSTAAGAGALATSDANDLRNQLANQKGLLDAILQDINERRAAEGKPAIAPAAGGKGPVENKNIKTESAPRSPGCAAIDRELDGLRAVGRAAPVGRPAPTAGLAAVDRELAGLRALDQEAAARRAAAAPTAPAVATRR